MITIRPSSERGHANHGWLDTHYSFSFSDYQDPAYMGFRDLRVINDDRIQGGAGFPTHGHRDMEIITYMINGALAHKDSTGGEGVIKRGEVQTMTAGAGVRHSEFNASATEAAHLLQIWVMPANDGLPAAYAQTHFSDADKHNRLCRIVAPKGAGDGLTINQDVSVYASILDKGASVAHDIAQNRAAWVQMVSGEIKLNDVVLKAGDGAAIEAVTALAITAQDNSEFLLFDLV